MSENISKIIKTFEDKGVTAYEIAKNTPLTEAAIGRILSGKTKNPQKSTILILQNYLDSINISDTNMVKEKQQAYKVSKDMMEAMQVDFQQMNVMYVPLVNKYAYAGYLNGFGDDEYLEELPKIPFANDIENKGEYLCFEVKGESMDDGSYEAYLEGDVLLCRNINPQYWVSKLHIKKWDFVIVHKEKGILVKRIIDHDVENGILTLHSLNDYYEDFKIHLKDVAKIFNIVDFRRKKSRR